MTKEKLNSTNKADKAWNKLYDRLYSENLIPDDSRQLKRGSKLPPALFWSAATIIILAGIAIMYLKNSGGEKRETLISQTNNETASLVKILEDGSTVYIAQRAALEYPVHFKTEMRSVSLKGEAFFDISKNPDRPFIIETESVKVKVIGTSFNIKSTVPTQFELAVREGRVRITLKKNGREQILSKNETAILSDSGFDIKYKNCDSLLFKYTSNFKFKDESLKNIINVIKRLHPEITIETSGEAESRKLTVAFANNEPEEMISLISQALSLNSYRNGNKFIIK